MKLHKIHNFCRKDLTAEIAENAEKVTIDNLCGLSELCGALKCFSSEFYILFLCLHKQLDSGFIPLLAGFDVEVQR